MRLARLVAGISLVLGIAGSAAAQQAQPNILWLTSEDNGPHIGAYGDAFALTPNLDALARRGVRYAHAWSTSPVCAPARTALITGMYPSSLGAEHMRSMVAMPRGTGILPALLGARGYYTSNNVKEDYNVARAPDAWDDSSPRAHWRHRPAGRPFFAVFNSTATHESQIRRRPHRIVHDPRRVSVPPYHPDTLEVRQDWAQYYDQMSVVDGFVGDRLAELEADGLAEDTIVFYLGDHGPGMPRGKRWLYQSGLHVPLIVYVPPRFRTFAPAGYAPGAAIDRLVSFVDMAPTMVSLAGAPAPEWMQGRAFMGAHATEPAEYAFGLRGRMDERYDLSRAARDRRHLYIRNYMPHRIYGQYLWYMFETPTTRVWRARYDAGGLAPAQRAFWEPKPAEELYDLDADPHNVVNLAAEPTQRATLRRLRAALDAHMAATRDVGLLPEHDMRARAGDGSPYDMARSGAYDVGAVLDAANRAVGIGPRGSVRTDLRHADPGVRYWGAVGALIAGRSGVETAAASLRRGLDDRALAPRIACAEALATYGTTADRRRALEVLLGAARVDRHGLYAALLALNALAHVPDLPDSARAGLRAAPVEAAGIDARERDYLPRLIEAILEGRR